MKGFFDIVDDLLNISDSRNRKTTSSNIYGGSLKGNPFTCGGIINSPDSTNDLLREFIKENDDGLAGEVLRFIDDTKDEFIEIMTDGFYQMVIKGNDDYKTSFEIKDEADKIISKELSKYNEKCREVKHTLDKLKEYINLLNERKVSLLGKVDPTKSSSLGYLSSSIINKKPQFDYKKINDFTLYKLVGVTELSIVKSRKNSANEYLEDAKDYRVYISKEIANLNLVLTNASVMTKVLDEEKYLLDVLEKKLAKCKFTNREVGRQLEIMLSNYILDENGEKNKLYIQAQYSLRALLV